MINFFIYYGVEKVVIFGFYDIFVDLSGEGVVGEDRVYWRILLV